MFSESPQLELIRVNQPDLAGGEVSTKDEAKVITDYARSCTEFPQRKGIEGIMGIMLCSVTVSVSSRMTLLASRLARFADERLIVIWNTCNTFRFVAIVMLGNDLLSHETTYSDCQMRL